MPYIKQERRNQIDVGYTPLWGSQPNTAGELNYLITTILIDYYSNKEGGYAAINDVLGALEGAKLEFYRRIAVPYEDQKIKENGDVYK
jgi:hypothetical protein